MPIYRPESKLSQNPYVTSKVYYPQDLGEQGAEPYMLFDIRSGVVNKDKSLGIIGLYLPQELQTKYSTQYQEMDMGVDKTAAGVWALMQGNLKDSILKGTANVLNELTADNTTAYLERLQGKIVNNHMAKLFKGVDFRVFNFTFDLAARNQKESGYIQNIIYQFKYHAMPAFDDATVKRHFLYPDNFIVSIHSPSSKYLFKIGTCALVDMQVEYNGSGQAAFFRSTGAPVNVKLSLTFAELELITKDKIQMGY